MIQAHSLADYRAPDGGAPHAAAPGSEESRVSAGKPPARPQKDTPPPPSLRRDRLQA